MKRRIGYSGRMIRSTKQQKKGRECNVGRGTRARGRGAMANQCGQGGFKEAAIEVEAMFVYVQASVQDFHD
jgi:hypothetical protein